MRPRPGAREAGNGNGERRGPCLAGKPRDDLRAARSVVDAEHDLDLSASRKRLPIDVVAGLQPPSQIIETLARSEACVLCLLPRALLDAFRKSYKALLKPRRSPCPRELAVFR
ncbi:hypothetical protein KO353_08070 [Elioraea tepida]|uniref:Uncharacterized protein n=1 Tax=Elioraea tepida TaxID=2843330 RepID=A0A975U4Y7_9PROT|nr:hypothetical protein [Elioraea tepida]QXM26127.1 hypothetical protein KO353_08070 [Elioraea tepida]